MTPPDATSAVGPVRLGALEQQVMDQLWDRGELTVREVISGLDSGLAYTTIATVLTNLQRKALVAHRREGRSVRYRALSSRSEHAASLMEQALSATDDRAASILHFVEGMDDRELGLLREYLDGHDDPGPEQQPPQDGSRSHP